MTASTTELKAYRKRFAWIFFGSFLVFIAVLVFNFFPSPTHDSDAAPPSTNSTNSVAHTPDSSPTLTTPTPNSFSGIVTAISLLSSLASLVGVAATTVLAWRKDRRDALQAALELQKKELELQKLRGEQSSKAESASSGTGRIAP